MNQMSAVILAAGQGTRMHSKKPKVLHTLFHRPMVQWVMDAAKEAGAVRICVVVGHGAQEVREVFADSDGAFALQAEQKGTGHAVLMAKDFIDPKEDVLILCGDTPLLQGKTLAQLAEFHRTHGNDVTVVSAMAQDPAGYGRIIRDAAGKFVKSVEHKDATEAERMVKEINTGVYLFRAEALLSSLGQLKNDNAQGEYYLPDCLEIIQQAGGKADAMTAEHEEEFLGVNSRIQLAHAAKVMQQRTNNALMEQGVTIVDPDHTYIDPGVSIGMDTVILPGTSLEGNTVIGEDCEIGPNCRFTNMTVGDRVVMQSVTALESFVGSDVKAGPFVYIRPGCHIGDHVKIGDFVELKNSNIGNGTKIPHLSYIGDTDAGERINFGCGSIMVNYDGQKKHRTTIGNDVFIGCNANLVAPVKIADGAYIAAGSTITRDVGEDVLAIARARQTEIPGWKERRFGKKETK